MTFRYCEDRPPRPTWASLTAEKLTRAMRKLEEEVGPATPENYATYKPTIDALLNAGKMMSRDEVSKRTGRRSSFENVALANLYEAKLLERRLKGGYRAFYKLVSIEKVNSHFNVAKEVSKRD